MHAEIISIGTELTSGQKLDTNSQWLSLQLADLGIPVHYHTTVADDLAANVAVLRAAAERADVVLVTGGLGPTLDDLTRQALAELGGVELVLHAPSLEFIEAFFRSRGRAMPERNRIQAMFPQGSEPLPNPIGTAPGIWMELSRSPRRATASATIDPVDQPPSPVAEAVPHAEVAHRCLLAAMPGVPSEMYRMFLEQVRPRLPGGGLLIRRARVNCFGLGESHVEELLGDLTARGRDPEIGITAHEATITLRIIAHGPTEDECRLKIDAARAEIRRRLGHYVFGDEDDELEHAVVRLLNERGRTLATAESGTGGLMSHLLTQSPGYEACYLGGLVVPSAAARRALLAIDDSADPISRETAGAMAAHCREAFHADYAVAVTQYPRIEPSAVMTAAPVAWLALASGSGVAVQEVNLGGNPAILRSRTAKAGLNLVRLRLIAGLLLAMCLGACREAPLPPAGVGTPANASQGGSTGAPGGRVEAGARFRDRTNAAGVDFTYRNDQEAGHYAILESLGGGVAVLDYDCDGRLDLFAPGGGAFAPGREIRGRPGAMFRSVGNWQYHNTTAAAALEPAPYYSHGAIVGDYDNDGFADVLVTGYGGLVLFRNLGDGTFQDAAADAGLDDRLWSSSAAWTDFDDDGDLDLYVAHYVNWSFDNDPACGTREKREVCPPRQFEPLPDSFYVNRGDGTFHEAAQDVGLRIDGKGLGVVAADIDLDGRQDLYVGNDTVPNFLYRNTGEGRYADESLLSGTSLSDEGTPDGSMGVDVGDFNGDGRPDIWVANYERETCALYANQGRWLFRHVSRVSGVTAVGGLYVGWGTLFLDMDLDGDEDILVANGHVIRHPVNAPLRQAPLLFQNQSGKRLVNVAPNAGDYMASPHMARGAAAGDLDADGDLDLAVTHTNEPLTVLECETPPGWHWLALRLTGTRSNRDANGAVAWLQTAEDSPVQVRQIKGGGSYASTSDRRLHFGLGPAASVETLRIRWPSGAEQTLHDVAADQELHLVEAGPTTGDGSVAESPAGRNEFRSTSGTDRHSSR
jgi:PncC family amidohydrolase